MIVCSLGHLTGSIHTFVFPLQPIVCLMFTCFVYILSKMLM